MSKSTNRIPINPRPAPPKMIADEYQWSVDQVIALDPGTKRTGQASYQSVGDPMMNYDVGDPRIPAGPS